MNLNFRTLTAGEVDARVQQVSSKGVSVLLYKNARVDMALLDEVVGPLNWKREHSRDNANCTVSIWDEDKHQWIPKEDTGTESNTEAAKGLASDSFKRACVNWGIGRELYTAPFIWIPADKCDINGNKCNTRFAVSDIQYNEDREITGLVIVNSRSGEIVYERGMSRSSTPKKTTGKKTKSAETASTPAPQTSDRVTIDQRKALFAAAKTAYGERATDELKRIVAEYGVESTENLTVCAFGEIMSKFTA